jgi:OOP family OmpA-OmpF porin
MMVERAALVHGLRRWQRLASCVWLCLCWLGCARSSLLDQQIDRTEQLVLDADANGALRCAPRQLAVARTQLEFAELERAQGFPSKAERHLVVADQHARAALLLSPPEHCRAQPALIDGDGARP